MMVPVQAFICLTLMYLSDVSSNSLVVDWIDSSDYWESMKYIAIDMVVEIVIYMTTVAALRTISSRIHPFKILRGLLRMHYFEFTLMSFVVWGIMLLFQSSYSGVDMKFDFMWLKSCTNNTSLVWLGGFDWSCPG